MSVREEGRLKSLVEMASGLLTNAGGVSGAFSRIWLVWRNDGWSGLRRLLRRIVSMFSGAADAAQITSRTAYHAWISQNDTLDDAARARIRSHIGTMQRKPLISVAMPVYNPEPRHLDEAIQSVRDQLYPYWELCIADDASTDPAVRKTIDRHVREDRRIKVAYRETNGHICRSTNTALECAKGDFVALLDHDDVLVEHALYWVASELEKFPDADVLYSDSDRINDAGVRFSPHFKSDFDLHLLLGQNMVSHLGVYRRSLVQAIGGMRVGYEGSQDHDFVLRAFLQSSQSRIRHIPVVLYHWRLSARRPTFSQRQLDRCAEAARRAVKDFLDNKGWDAEVLPAPEAPHHQRIRYRLPSPAPSVSVIVPSKNHVGLLRGCVDGLLRCTDYPDLEILVVDSGSDDRRMQVYLKELAGTERVRVLNYPGPFNVSGINNFAVRQASGTLVAFLHDAIEVTGPGWLAEMVSYAARPDIGAVGAKLYGPDGRVQHAGVVLGIGGIADHLYRGMPHLYPGSFGALVLTREVSALATACMVMRKSVFFEVGGFDEENLPVAFNGVDLCLRIREAGYTNIVTPFAELTHHESATQGLDPVGGQHAELQKEYAYMRERWGSALLRDPYFNPNLSLESTNPRFAESPRISRPWEH
jgi:glycosyltransferase involved in cell wall biosynthesis